MSDHPQRITTEPIDDEQRYFNRDLSEIGFHKRVLAQAADDQLPLLERVRFLGLLTDNLDEFSMKRIGEFKRRIATSPAETTPDGKTPEDVLTAIRAEIAAVLTEQAALYNSTLRPALADAGIELVTYESLTQTEQESVTSYFESSILPTLTPLSFDSAHPFPHISNRSLSLAVLTRTDPDADVQFSRVKLPENRPRFVPTGDGRYVLIEDVIAAHLDLLFPGVEIVHSSLFRVMRSAEVDRNEEQAEDLVDMMEDVIEKRRFAPVVRLDIAPTMDQRARTVLATQLDVEPADIYELPGPLDYRDFIDLIEEGDPSHRYDRWTPQPHPRLPQDDDHAGFFSTIRERDVLVHHPYYSFAGSVQRFFEHAAEDPKVLAVKASIYRTEENSAVVQSLIDAARNGKQVAANVELKARFDEQQNIRWVERLEEEGIHVAYGTVGLKTHSKTAVVVREEQDGVRVYTHLGTGNYNSKTAKIYEDVSLLTADQAIGQDLIKLFNFFTGRSLSQDYEKLLVAPANMKRRFKELIRRETAHAREGHDAQIVAKMNRLEHPELIDELYEAAQAGVTIELIVRDICCLRPGVDGLSENISIRSIVGRFLEHSRIFSFYNAGSPEYYIGSADWMVRNLENRVEAVAPVVDPQLQEYLKTVLELARSDATLAWELQPDGTYTQVPTDGQTPQSLQDQLMERATRQSSW